VVGIVEPSVIVLLKNVMDGSVCSALQVCWPVQLGAVAPPPPPPPQPARAKAIKNKKHVARKFWLRKLILCFMEVLSVNMLRNN
jgi:hypothetical protein